MKHRSSVATWGVAGALLLAHASGWTQVHNFDSPTRLLSSDTQLSETIHSGTGTSIGNNIEQSNMSDRGRVIGLNIQAKDGYGGVQRNYWSDEAINIQSSPRSGWKSGLKFNQVNLEKGIVFDAGSSGKTAIDVGGRFDRGINLNGNNLVLGRGARIVLDEGEEVVLLFNKESLQIGIRAADELVVRFPLAAKKRARDEVRPGTLD